LAPARQPRIARRRKDPSRSRHGGLFPLDFPAVIPRYRRGIAASGVVTGWFCLGMAVHPFGSELGGMGDLAGGGLFGCVVTGIPGSPCGSGNSAACHHGHHTLGWWPGFRKRRTRPCGLGGQCHLPVPHTGRTMDRLPRSASGSGYRGSLLLAAWVFARFSDLFDSLLARGGSFIALGLALFAVALFYHRQRQNKITASAGREA